MFSEIPHYFFIVTLIFTIIFFCENIYISTLKIKWKSLIHDINIFSYVYLLKYVILYLWVNVTFFLYSYINSDFTLINIVKHSNVLEPLFYKCCGFWGNQDGSMILWSLVLGIYGFLFILKSHKEKLYFFFKTLKWQYINIIFFIFFITFSSNPWLKTLVFFKNGLELNPLLQDFALSIHPPLLYTGYLGFSILFSLSLIVLKEKFLPKHWFYYIKYFNTLAWITLSFGIALGSWWAYYELGWGGWWFWDPVENISLVPWLLSTALIHNIILYKKFNILNHWNISLTLMGYVFTLWSTYVIRSGSLKSVHSFAQDSLGSFIILMFIVVTLVHVSIYIIKNYLYVFNYFQFSLYSKENFMRINNIILIMVAFIILLTIDLPNFIYLFYKKEFSLSPNFYNELFIPLIIPFLIFMIITSFIPWKRFVTLKNIFMNDFILGFLISSALSLIFIKNVEEILKFILVILLIWSFLNLLKFFMIIKNFNAMYIGHSAILLFLFSMIMGKYFQMDLMYLIYPGEKIIFENYYTLIFRNINYYTLENYKILFFDLFINNFNKLESLIFSEHRYYLLNGSSTIKPNVLSNLFSDLYITLGKGDLEAGWYLKIILNPFMAILWISSFFLVMAGVIILKSLSKNKLKTHDFYNSK